MTAKRIGPKMSRAVAIVTANPGCSIFRVARQVGPNGSLKFGYRTVHRAITAGLIQYTRSNRRYYLTVPS